jgi:signal transduction histidine kinase
MRQDLTRMVIHDLRNPLSSIMSSLQLIRAAYDNRDESVPVAKLLRIATRSGQKLHRLIDSLLDLGRLETGEAELRKVLVDPGELIREAVEQIQPLALDRGQEVGERIAAGLPGVLADRDLILRVLANLLDNAVKYTPKGGNITVAVERVGDRLLFTLSDTGPGIPVEFRQRIFGRFARLEGAEGLDGVGLGLTFCKLAVDAHNGRIWVEGEEGKGSQFKFTLPLSEGSAE